MTPIPAGDQPSPPVPPTTAPPAVGAQRLEVEGAEPPRLRTRAGRNLPMAIAVGVALATLVLVSLYVRRVAFVGVASAAVVVAVWELSGALRAGGMRAPRIPVLAGGLAIVVSAWSAGAPGVTAALAATVLAVLAWRLLEGPDGAVDDVAAGVLTTLYVPFLASFAILLLRPDDGAERVTLLVLLVVCSDVGGYAAGVFFGRHPMAPTISPKKSWEGFAGSALACLVCGVVAGPLLIGLAWWQGALLGAAAVCSATVGDLGESLIKRDLGIKDMGSMLPGHGGLMDRLDSLLPTAPVVFLVLAAVGAG